MSDPAGKNYWEDSANKLLDIGLDFLRYKIVGVDKTSSSSSLSSTSVPSQTVTASGFTTYLPYIMLGLSGLGIVLIMIKR